MNRRTLLRGLDAALPLVVGLACLAAVGGLVWWWYGLTAGALPDRIMALVIGLAHHMRHQLDIPPPAHWVAALMVVVVLFWMVAWSIAQVLTALAQLGRARWSDDA